METVAIKDHLSALLRLFDCGKESKRPPFQQLQQFGPIVGPSYFACDLFSFGQQLSDKKGQRRAWGLKKHSLS